MDDGDKKKFLREKMTNSGNDSIIRDDLRKLLPGSEVDDSIINFYFNQCLSNRDKSYLFYSTHFWTNLMNVDEFWNVGEYKFKKVKWWKRNNLFEMKKKIFIPINETHYHWVLVVIDIEKKKIQHYDSIQRSETSTEITESNKAKKDWIIY